MKLIFCMALLLIGAAYIIWECDQAWKERQ